MGFILSFHRSLRHSLFRCKALEYAKTIAKPSVLQQPKKNQTQRSRGAIEGLNMSDLSRLEILKKRHDDEKKAFALLTK